MLNKTPVAMKPLTERQQMALLLQMTSEHHLTPIRKNKNENESPSSAQRSINRRNERGETPLHVASIRGDVLKVRTLISQGADIETTDYAGKLLIFIYLFDYFFRKEISSIVLKCQGGLLSMKQPIEAKLMWLGSF